MTQQTINAQQQFDAEMTRLRAMQYARTGVYHQEIDELDRKREALRQQICDIQGEIRLLTSVRMDFERKIHEINREYHQMKHDLIMSFPKQGGAGD